MSEKLNIYKEKLENSIEIQIGHLIKQKFSNLTIKLFILLFFGLIFSVGLMYFINVTVFSLFPIFVFSILFGISLISCLFYYEKFHILSNKEVLEILDISKEYEINEIIINKYKEQGCIYQIQKDLVCKYIEEQKEIEVEKEIEKKIKEQDENEN